MARRALVLTVMFLAFGPALPRGAYEAPARKTPPGGNPFLEALVQRAAAAAFLGDAEAALALAHEARAYEERHAAELNGFRISDNLTALAATLAPTRTERLELAAQAARGADRSTRQWLARLRRNDPLLEARRLEKRVAWSRLAAVGNGLSQSLFGLANGNTQALFKWPFDLALSWRGAQSFGPEQRKQRVLYDRFLERCPDDPDAARAGRALEKLDGKSRRQTSKDLLALSELHYKAGQPAEALFLAGKAEEAGGQARQAKLKATQALTRRRRDQSRSVAIDPQDPEPPDNPEAKALEGLLTALVVGDAEGLEGRAEAFRRDFPRSSHRDEADYLAVVATRLDGRTDESARRLKAMAASSDEANMTIHADNMIRSDAANPQAAWRRARAEHGAGVRRFILQGIDSPGDRLESAAAGGGIQTHGLLDQTLSALFFVDSLMRAVKHLAGAGPSDDGVRDAAGAWLRAEPDSPRAKDLASYLGKRLESGGQYERALAFHEKAGEATTRMRDRMREKEARDLYLRIQQVEDPAQRRELFEQAAPRLAGTKHEEKAQRETLKALEASRIVLSKSVLAQTPALWNGRGLDLPPGLFDGRPENGEMTETGAAFLPPDWRVVELAVVRDGREEPRRIRLEGSAHAEALAALDEHRLLSARREAAEDLLGSGLPPLELHGSIGAAGLLVYPTLLPYQLDPEELPLYR
jgi:hypothetical protein